MQQDKNKLFVCESSLSLQGASSHIDLIMTFFFNNNFDQRKDFFLKIYIS